jgi:FkbM family methyltransferase
MINIFKKNNIIISDIKLLKEKLNSLEKKHSELRELFAGVIGSKSQYLQDLFVLNETSSKEGGFFVDFGATNGVEGSNSFLLEQIYGWSGILAEPAKCWHESLYKNRKAKIDKRCVWAKSGEQIEFHEAEIAVLSSVKNCCDSDHHSKLRSAGYSYNVETISLNDLLVEHNAPKIIDYLSIDTEGSEYIILQNFDFSQFDIRIITVEHNFSVDRENIYNLLSKNGYVRKYDWISECDDWYVRIK